MTWQPAMPSGSVGSTNGNSGLPLEPAARPGSLDIPHHDSSSLAWQLPFTPQGPQLPTTTSKSQLFKGPHADAEVLRQLRRGLALLRGALVFGGIEMADLDALLRDAGADVVPGAGRGADTAAA
jgi:hypothetical protein